MTKLPHTPDERTAHLAGKLKLPAQPISYREYSVGRTCFDSGCVALSRSTASDTKAEAERLNELLGDYAIEVG